MHICRQVTKHVAARVSTWSLRLPGLTINPRLFSTYPALNKSTEDSEPRILSSTPSAERYRRKWANDPVWREKEIERNCRKNKLRRKIDPEFRARKKAAHDACHARKSEEDPYYRILKKINFWIHQKPFVREQLKWKSHDLAWSPEKVTHRCASCNIKRRDGLKLWLRRRTADADTEEFDCWACFISDPQRALPEGFKDVETIQQLDARRQQLFGIKAHVRRSPPKTSPSPDSP